MDFDPQTVAKMHPKQKAALEKVLDPSSGLTEESRQKGLRILERAHSELASQTASPEPAEAPKPKVAPRVVKPQD